MKRFWDKVDIKGPDDCWEWQAGTANSGYGTFARSASQITTAHRTAFIEAKGDIPEGLVVMHSCANRLCCNPAHLAVGTQSENRHEMVTRSVNPHQKISQEEAELILWCYRQGPRIGNYGWGKKVAQMLGVTQNAISDLVRRRTFQEAG